MLLIKECGVYCCHTTNSDVSDNVIRRSPWHKAANPIKAHVTRSLSLTTSLTWDHNVLCVGGSVQN